MPHDQDAVLDVRNLRKSFGGVVAVDDASLRVLNGSIHGLLGPNGAGKTTMLNLISGFLAPDEGEIIGPNGVAIDGMPAYKVARQDVARTYQNVRLFDGMTVLDTVVAGFYMHRRPGILRTFIPGLGRQREQSMFEDRADALLRQVGVTSDRRAISTELSYGEQRRVEIARALASDPTLLLLDEPSAGMNSAESTALGDLFQQLQQSGTTLLLIEHNMELVRRFCNATTVMNFGRVLVAGEPEECLSHPEVLEAYFGKAKHA
ncbi:ABC transporter ATP-binding protein [Microbacterium alcoholitolerans]|uniref:ABC transporter ATP-binding protein n=1 Tax=unclassified Microbacterium TaxID=2609290 RepID=UPI003D16ECA3